MEKFTRLTDIHLLHVMLTLHNLLGFDNIYPFCTLPLVFSAEATLQVLANDKTVAGW